MMMHVKWIWENQTLGGLQFIQLKRWCSFYERLSPSWIIIIFTLHVLYTFDAQVKDILADVLRPPGWWRHQAPFGCYCRYCSLAEAQNWSPAVSLILYIFLSQHHQPLISYSQKNSYTRTRLHFLSDPICHIIQRKEKITNNNRQTQAKIWHLKIFNNFEIGEGGSRGESLCQGPRSAEKVYFLLGSVNSRAPGRAKNYYCLYPFVLPC